MAAPLARLVRAALPMFALALVSCSGDLFTTSPERGDLAAAKRRWARFAPASYQVTVALSCFCPQEVIRPAVVTVRNGQVESRKYEDTGADVPVQFAGAFPTVDGLFGVIDAAIAAKAETVDVVYDATRGFPVSIVIDGAARIADDETFYSTRNFVVR